MHVAPHDAVEMAIHSGVLKASLPVVDMVVRGMFAGFFAGITAAFVNQLTTYTGNGAAGGLLFFSGFIMLAFYGFELVTGNMLLLTMALLARRAPLLGALKNLLIVTAANFMGAVLYTGIFFAAITYSGEISGMEAKGGNATIAVGQSKTVAYYNHGGAGWLACFLKAILCNFLVGFGMLGNLVGTTTTGKVAGIFFPVSMFATLGFEHVVINMYAGSMAMVLGGGISWGQWFGYSLAPSFCGNFVGAMLIAFPMWITMGHQYRGKERASQEEKLAANCSMDDDMAQLEEGMATSSYPVENFDFGEEMREQYSDGLVLPSPTPTTFH
eukprot:EG_transcript_14223